MILVADSGSTKCDWLIVSSNKTTTETKTMGFNPLFHSSEVIRTELNNNRILREHASAISHVYFYGAGCSSDARKQIIHEVLVEVFENANDIIVDHDLAAAALSISTSSR